MTDYVARKGLFVPTPDELTLFRQRHGIAEPDKEAEQKALQELKDRLGKTIIDEAKPLEPLFGSPDQGAGALQTVMVAAIDTAAEGLAAYNGKRSAAALLRAAAEKIEKGPA